MGGGGTLRAGTKTIEWLFHHCFLHKLEFATVGLAGTKTTSKLNPHMESNPDHIGGRQVLTPWHHPCSLKNIGKDPMKNRKGPNSPFCTRSLVQCTPHAIYRTMENKTCKSLGVYKLTNVHIDHYCCCKGMKFE